MTLAFLERFDAPNNAAPEPLPVTEQDGYAAGYEAGKQDEQARQDTLKAEVIEKLTDMSFVYAEAKQDVLASITPLIQTLADKLLPELTADVARVHLVDCLQKAAQSDVDQPMKLQAAQSDLEALKASLPEDLPMKVSVEPKEGLLPGECLITAPSGETTLNATQLIENIREILSGMTQQTKRTAQNG